jgi:hypothetical protein
MHSSKSVHGLHGRIHCNAGRMGSLPGTACLVRVECPWPSTDVAPSWRRPDRVFKSAVVINFPLGTRPHGCSFNGAI